MQSGIRMIRNIFRPHRFHQRPCRDHTARHQRQPYQQCPRPYPAHTHVSIVDHNPQRTQNLDAHTTILQGRPRAAELIDRLDYDTDSVKLSTGVPAAIAIRTSMLDRAAAEFVRTHPAAASG